MLLDQIKLLLDYSLKNNLNTQYQEISGEIISGFKINDNMVIYLNGNQAFLSGMSYIKEIDLYYSDGLYINLGKVTDSVKEKDFIIKLYEKLTSVSLLEYFTSSVYVTTLDFDFNITQLSK